jgi:hypothetical protein
MRRSVSGRCGMPTECAEIKRASDRRRSHKRHAYYRLRNYGLTQEKWEQLLAEQGNVCAICRKPFTSKRSPSVDHDHESGRVAGFVASELSHPGRFV